MNDSQFAVYEARCATAARLKVEILPHNKQVLFDALSTAGIAVVTVGFDGCGDSGQFEAPSAFAADNESREVPNTEITVQCVDFERSQITQIETSVRNYIEQLVCDLLEEKHEGWEDGDGAYGEFRLSLDERSVTLEYSERYTATNYYEHEF